MSEEKTFTLEIITPEKSVFQGQVTSVTCPGSDGLFQVLVNHAPLLASLGIGVCTVVEAGGGKEQYAVSGGFAQVLHNSVLMLADSAERSSEIDTSRAERAKARAEERLRTHDPNIDVERARVALSRSLNRLRVASNQ